MAGNVLQAFQDQFSTVEECERLKKDWTEHIGFLSKPVHALWPIIEPSLNARIWETGEWPQFQQHDDSQYTAGGDLCETLRNNWQKLGDDGLIQYLSQETTRAVPAKVGLCPA